MLAIAVVALLVCFPSVGSTQVLADPNQGNIRFTGNFDFVNAYMFRGLRQDDTGLIMWPSFDAGINLHRGTGSIERADLHVGTWNSLHTGLAGLDGPTGRLWYENRIYGTLDLGLSAGVNVGTTFTAYTSPNGSFSTVKELAFRVGSEGTLRPYGLVAFEFDTHPGLGQADGGREAGTYLEIGVAPGWADAPINVTFPISVGLSLDDYYELAGVDHPFGFLSLGALATLPISGLTHYGSWNVHGGLQFLSLGDTPEAFNAGEQQKLVASIGIGFSY
jgi:hypothetical protein